MSLPVVLRDAARAEFDQAFDHYVAIDIALGLDFVARVGHTFDQIAAQPELYPVELGDVRKAVVKRFPFCVFYRAHANRIEVIAVFDARRDPAIWQRRT